MPKCKVFRTHRQGEALRDRDFDPPVEGPVEMFSIVHPVLKRQVDVLRVPRMAEGGGNISSAIPDLYEPKLITFSTDRAMMVSGFEEVGGRRMYQGWWIKWDDDY